MHPRTTTAVVIGTLLAAVAAAPAMAAPPPVVDLRGAGVGTYVLDVEGTAHLVGDVTGAPFDGTYAATLAELGRQPSGARGLRDSHRVRGRRRHQGPHPAPRRHR